MNPRSIAYRDTRAYLCGLTKMGIRFGLDPINGLLGRLQDPQQRYPSVLIAGTNGKGSVAAMIAAILSAGGYRTGLYTSPDLIDFRERIRVDGEMISREEATICAARVRAQVREEISYFEFLTAMAFLHFRRRRVDIAVLEVGMGGRLDATNVVVPLIAVITNTSLEHRQYLGDTLEAIAREKGGIIKQGGRVLTAARQKPVVDTLDALCRDRNAELYRLGREIRTRVHRDGTFSYRGIGRRFARLTCPLVGRHQYANAALALGAVELIADAGFPVPGDRVVAGLERTRWEGRLEVLRRAPTLLVDGAHNPAGAETLRRALRENFSYRRLILIFGVLGDKDYPAMARRLFPLADRVILTRPPSDRAVPLEELLPIARRFHAAVEGYARPADALRAALSRAGERDLVCAAGSLYLVGAIKKLQRAAARTGSIPGGAAR